MAIKVGSKVKFSRRFLQSIQASATDELWSATGQVTEFRGSGNLRRARVRWAGESEDRSALVSNLTEVQ